MAAKDAKKMDVTREDQENINSFNKLNSKVHELEAQIKAKKKLLEDLEDASNELMLSDEDSIRYVVGECFLHTDRDNAEERLQGMTETITEDVQGLNGQIDELKEQMKKLKAMLYGKFGNSINLEE